ncbi:hypothetical protein [Caldalkalibacillus mannanilyticus]|uniref:hypothetical protein n=1 Tax=Caldalkalibacillus mannanilyticus TaxID=1418 RepID=UPI0004688182|nr:hypothetical protein [Caldalkalibacillus mannanilyticus]
MHPPNEIRDHIIVRLIQEVQENRFGDRFKFKIDAIPHAGLYEISLIDQDKVLWKRYDIHLKEALFAGLVQLYGLFYQNESITNEMLTEKDSGYYSVQEALIDQVLDGAASKDVLTLVSDVLDQMGCRIELVEWKYNHYLKEAGMSCYKILMGMEESS